MSDIKRIKVQYPSLIKTVKVKVPGISSQAAIDAAAAAEAAAEGVEVFADAAAASATAAAASAAAASTSATNAATAETNAETAETNAETAATNAATSETNAANSASAASTSATNASNSASAASASETNAGNSATAADASADAAAASAAEAAGYAASIDPSSFLTDVTEGTGISIDKTDPQNPVISATGGGDVAGETHAASSKTTPIDADEIPLVDTAASNVLKKLTWANLKATLKTYFDALYQSVSARLTDIAALAVTDGNFIVGNGTTWVAESGATARTSLGLGTAATLNSGTSSGNVPVLDGSGKLVTSILPAMALTDTYIVASQAAMLALSAAQQGDLAIRTDINKSFVLSSNSPSTLADWKELLTPTDAVLSVAGLTGAISASGLRSALNLVIGTDVQAYNALITAIAALGSNGLVARTAAGTAAARTITGTANQLTVTNGDGVSGNPTLSLPADVLIPTALTVPNTGLHLLDTNGSHDVILKPGSDVTADRTITIVTGDSDRTLDLTISSGGGAYEFVGNFTASAATSLVITSGFHADYDEYVFNIRNMVTSTSTFLTLQVYEDGGTTPIGGTAYSSGGSVTTNGTSYWRFHTTSQAATSLSIGEVKLLRCSTTLTGMLSQTVQRTTTGSALPATQHGHVVTTAKINAVRWSVDAGNITIDVDMYRVKHT